MGHNFVGLLASPLVSGTPSRLPLQQGYDEQCMHGEGASVFRNGTELSKDRQQGKEDERDSGGGGEVQRKGDVTAVVRYVVEIWTPSIKRRNDNDLRPASMDENL